MDRTLEWRLNAPERPNGAAPLLLVHGAWHGAWCWDAASADFLARGFTVGALSLRGHGASAKPRWFNLCGLADYVRDVERAIDAMPAPPIVIAHSLGGRVLQEVLKRRRLPGVVLLASVPVTGTSHFVPRRLRLDPVSALRNALPWRTRELVAEPKIARALFFRPETPLEEVAGYAAQMGPEAMRLVVETAFPNRRPKAEGTPLLVIAAERDQVFSLAEQEATAAAYGVPLHIIPEAAHDLMLDPAWPEAAALIIAHARAWS